MVRQILKSKKDNAEKYNDKLLRKSRCVYIQKSFWNANFETWIVKLKEKIWNK
jgi:hypothetical protein